MEDETDHKPDLTAAVPAAASVPAVVAADVMTLFT